MEADLKHGPFLCSPSGMTMDTLQTTAGSGAGVDLSVD